MTRRRATPRIPAPVPPLHPRLHRAMPRPMRAISSTPRRSCRPMSLRPESYDGVETVVRRVRTKQPVALIFCGRTHRSCQARLGLLLRLCLRSWVPRSRRWATACSWCCPPVARSKIPISRSFVPAATLSKDKTRRFPSTSTLSSSWVSTLFNFYSTLIVVYCFMTWISHEAGWFASGYCCGA